MGVSIVVSLGPMVAPVPNRATDPIVLVRPGERGRAEAHPSAAVSQGRKGWASGVPSDVHHATILARDELAPESAERPGSAGRSSPRSR